jgi:hypothetical protein
MNLPAEPIVASFRLVGGAKAVLPDCNGVTYDCHRDGGHISMKDIARWVALATIAAAWAACGGVPPAQGKDGMLKFLFKYEGTGKCVIRENHGGIEVMHTWAAEEALEKGIHCVIDGECSSACVVFASKARANVCLTKRAQIGIHYGYTHRVFDPSGEELKPGTARWKNVYFAEVLPPGYHKEIVYYVPDYGKDITAWALAENKMPKDEADMYFLSDHEADKYWTRCPSPAPVS